MFRSDSRVLTRSSIVRRGLLAAVLFVAGTAAVGGPAVATHVQASSAHKTLTINVTATEFKFKLSKKSATAPATIHFVVTNKGSAVHNFKINGKVTKNLQPGQSATLTVSFTKAGSYPYLCTIFGHADLGMKGTFKVK